MGLVLDFVGEKTEVPDGEWVTLGREGDVVIDDNPYLHRLFLQVGYAEGLPWIVNLGDQLSATVSDTDGRPRAPLSNTCRLVSDTGEWV